MQYSMINSLSYQSWSLNDECGHYAPAGGRPGSRTHLRLRSCLLPTELRASYSRGTGSATSNFIESNLGNTN